MKTCKICGKAFETEHSNERFCSAECKKEWRRREVEKLRSKQTEKILTLEEVSILAAAENMSYGKYSVKYDLYHGGKKIEYERRIQLSKQRENL